MKKFLLLALSAVVIVLLVIVVVVNIAERNRGINFEQNKEWKEVLRKAKKEKKLIFVYCYTSRHGNDNELNREVFTQEIVADFFNKNFISVEYEEKDVDGDFVQEQFAVKSFPIFLFVDPEIDKVVNRLSGFPKVDRLIERGKIAIDTQKKLSGMMKRYESGERGYEFIVDYMSILVAAYMYEEKERVAIDYLNSLPSEQFATKDNWDFIIKRIFDPLSSPLKKVMANRDEFYKFAEKEDVDWILESRIMIIVNGLIDIREPNPSKRTDFDEQLNTDLINYLLSIDSCKFVYAELATLSTADYIRKSDFRGLLNKMRDVLIDSLLYKRSEESYFRHNIKVFAYCKEKELVEEAIEWIDQRCDSSSDYLNKANLMESKSYIQELTGDTKGAEKTKVEEAKYENEFEKSTGRSRTMSVPLLKSKI